jgi:HSP20 family molecular chaperone IbpA
LPVPESERNWESEPGEYQKQNQDKEVRKQTFIVVVLRSETQGGTALFVEREPGKLPRRISLNSTLYKGTIRAKFRVGLMSM